MKCLLVVGLVVGLSIGYALAEGPGHATDWQAFRQWTLGLPHDMGIWNPYWAKLLLSPLAWLPQDAGHAVLNGLTFMTVLIAGNQIWPLLTFALHDNAWVGNLDGFIILGIILARCQSPYITGGGLFLLSIKPQYLPLGLYYLWRGRDYRLLILPFIGFSLSLLIYGNWLPEWLAILPPTPHQSVNISFYPWSLPIWLLIPFAADKERFILAATIVATPYFNQISLITLFAFGWSTWAAAIFIILSWTSPLLIGPGALLYALFIQPETNPLTQEVCTILTNFNKLGRTLWSHRVKSS